jgi:hypothetical protein
MMASRRPQRRQATVQDTALREKLRKIEALFAGAATPGERDAAEAAMLRVRARLAEIGRSEQPVEMQFSIQDQWAQRLFVALCRRYGLRPYRQPRQKRSTIMVRLPRAFSDQILWPEFVQLNEVLHAHLQDITLKLIRDYVHADTGDAEEVAEKG